MLTFWYQTCDFKSLLWDSRYLIDRLFKRRNGAVLVFGSAIWNMNRLFSAPLERQRILQDPFPSLQLHFISGLLWVLWNHFLFFILHSPLQYLLRTKWPIGRPRLFVCVRYSLPSFSRCTWYLQFRWNRNIYRSWSNRNSADDVGNQVADTIFRDRETTECPVITYRPTLNKIPLIFDLSIMSGLLHSLRMVQQLSASPKKKAMSRERHEVSVDNRISRDLLTQFPL